MPLAGAADRTRTAMRLTPHTADAFVLAAVDPAFAADPYPDFRMLRDHAPACRQPDGSVLVTRYDDVREVLTDADRFSSDKKVDFRPKFGDSPLYEHHTTSIVFVDPPEHTRIRRLLSPFFAFRTVQRMEARIAAMVDELLDDLAERRTIDFMRDFALAIPLNLIGDLLGVPRDEREPLRGWANLILGALEPNAPPERLVAGNQAVIEFKQYLRDLIAWKRAHPQAREDTDVLWALIDAHDAGSGLTESEILHSSIFMLNAGHDTTTSLLANGMDLLFRHPAEWARLRAEPGLMKTAIEEMLRFESPLQIGNRKMRVDAHVGGVDLPAGTFLHVAIAAANRDDRQFPDPDRFDIGRDPNRHLAFGHGAHFCAGNAVARMEATIAFSKLFARFGEIRQAGPTVRPQRARFRVVEALPVELLP